MTEREIAERALRHVRARREYLVVLVEAVENAPVPDGVLEAMKKKEVRAFRELEEALGFAFSIYDILDPEKETTGGPAAKV